MNFAVQNLPGFSDYRHRLVDFLRRRRDSFVGSAAKKDRQPRAQ
jgi:hypothetical protein